MKQLSKEQTQAKIKELMNLYKSAPQDLTAGERQFLVEQKALTQNEVDSIKGHIYVVPKKYYECFDKDIDFRKCIGFAQGVNVASEMSEEAKQAMIDDGLVIDEDTHWNQLDNLLSDGEITQHEREFIEDNFEMLRSWANFRPYFEIYLKDDVEGEDDIEDELNSCGLVATDYFVNIKKASGLINDNFDTVEETWESLSDEEKKEALDIFLNEYDLTLADVAEANIILKQAYMTDNDSYLEKDFTTFKIKI